MQPRRQRKQRGPNQDQPQQQQQQAHDDLDEKDAMHSSAVGGCSRCSFSCTTRRFVLVMIVFFLLLHAFVVSFLVKPPFSLVDLVDTQEVEQKFRRALRPSPSDFRHDPRFSPPPSSPSPPPFAQPEGDGLSWRGTNCHRSSLLTHEKLVRYCRNPAAVSMPVAPAYCAKILAYAAQARSPNNDGSVLRSPPCGFFLSGEFNAAPPLHNIPSLKDARTSIGCHNSLSSASAGVFGGTQSNDTLFAQMNAEGDMVEFPQHRVLPKEHGEEAAGTPQRCSKSFRYLNRVEMLSVLHAVSIEKHGRGIIFSGDSMVRQLMLRLVFFLRGKKEEEVMAEHYFHDDALYVIYKNPASDELIVLPRVAAQRNQTVSSILQTFFPGYLSSSTPSATPGGAAVADNVLVAILFVWDPYVETFRKDVLSAFAAAPVHVSAFMFWWQKTETPAAINTYLDAMEANMNVKTCTAPQTEQVNPNHPIKQFIYLTTPNTTGFKDEHLRHERNAILRSRLGEKPRWCATSSQESVSTGHTTQSGETAVVAERSSAGQSQYSSVRTTLLDYAAIADTRLLPRTMDHIHYMCTWTETFPKQISKMKYNKYGCTDPTNLAGVQWLAHLLLDTL